MEERSPIKQLYRQSRSESQLSVALWLFHKKTEHEAELNPLIQRIFFLPHWNIKTTFACRIMYVSVLRAKFSRVMASFILVTGVHRTDFVDSLKKLNIVSPKKASRPTIVKRFHWVWNKRRHATKFSKVKQIRRTSQTNIFQKQFFKPLRKLISQKALNSVKWVNLGHKSLAACNCMFRKIVRRHWPLF